MAKNLLAYSESDPHGAGHKGEGCWLCFSFPSLIETSISSEEIIWSNKHSGLVGMKNSSGERAWNVVCVYCNIWLSSWNFIDYIIQAGTCFSERKGYSADGSILESLPKTEEIISGSY